MVPGRSVAWFVLLWLAAIPATAQRHAEIFGRIVDQSSGAVADASITIQDEETGYRRVAQSDILGGYAVGSLTPGSYKITIRKEGFRPVMEFGVKVTSAEATRRDFQLSVGSVGESVTVIGTAPAMERTDASTGAQFDFDEAAQLPLNGRGLLTVMELIPGTNVIPATRGEAGQFTTSGMRPNTNYFTVDGVSANTGVSAGGLPAQASAGSLPALSAFGSLDSLISLEAVQELKLQSSTTVAEFGRMPGASIALNSRAGTEQIHGATVFRFRNQVLGANNWFANQAGLGRAPVGYQDLAPSLGGPLKRNRTFFFLSFERIWLNQPYQWKLPVPSDDLRAAVSPAERAVLNLYPAQNQGALGQDVGEWTGQTNRPAGLTSGSMRIDQAITPRVTFFGRYGDSPSHNNFGMPQVNHLNLRSQSLTFGLNARPTARTVLDTRVNESQSTADSVWTDSNASETPSCTLPFFAAGFFSRTGPTITCDYLARFSIDGIGQIISGAEGSRKQRQFQLVQMAGWNGGDHEFKLGLDYRRILAVRRDPSDNVGLISPSAGALTNFQSWWMGTGTGVRGSVPVQELSLWAQDTWRVNSRLTVAAGLRWEFSPPPTVDAYFPNAKRDDVALNHQDLWPTSLHDYAPRLGLALLLSKSGRTVLRAGGGLYYDSSMSIATDLLNGGPFSATLLKTQQGGSGVANLIFGFDTGLKLPEIRQWNVSLEQGLGSHDWMSVGYVGSSGRFLTRREVGAPPISNTYIVALTTDHGSSDYDALQVQYRRHVAHGLDAAASYSWSHSLDDDSSDAFLLWSNYGAGLAGDHASSDFDLRHSLTAAVSYEVPVRKDHTFAGRLLGGWGIDGVLHSRTGFPITVLTVEEIDSIGVTNAYRPNWVYGQPLWIGANDMPGGRVLNPAAFASPGLNRQGNLGRNVPGGFGMRQLDLSVKREFHLGEQRGLQLRIEAFNALNQANFADPIRYLDSPLFGQSTSMLNMMLGTGSSGSGLAPTLQTGGPRSVQISARFHF
jgi:hypothetical protein